MSMRVCACVRVCLCVSDTVQSVRVRNSPLTFAIGRRDALRLEISGGWHAAARAMERSWEQSMICTFIFNRAQPWHAVFLGCRFRLSLSLAGVANAIPCGVVGARPGDWRWLLVASMLAGGGCFAAGCCEALRIQDVYLRRYGVWGKGLCEEPGQKFGRRVGDAFPTQPQLPCQFCRRSCLLARRSAPAGWSGLLGGGRGGTSMWRLRCFRSAPQESGFG